LGAACVALPVAGPVHAQPTGEVQEIIVTATRRAETLSTVAISAAAVTQQKLDDQGIRSVADLQRTVPGLRFNPGTNTIAIRGISSTAGAATTGVYIDETPIQMLNIGIGTTSAVPALFDLERVEVLRGPQGTLFGAGAQGGVVRYITPQPSLTTFSGNARAELGFIENGGQDSQVAAAVGGPIVEGKLGFRINAFHRNIGGWIDRIDYRDYQLIEKDYNSGRITGGRVALTWAPTEHLQITPSVVIQDRSSRGGNNFSEYWSNPGRGEFVTAIAQPSPEKDRWYLPAVKVQYDFGGVELISNTSWFVRNSVTAYSGIDYMTSVYDADPGSFLPGVGVMFEGRRRLVNSAGVQLPIGNYDVTAATTNNQRNFVQEVRLQSADPDARLTWVAGAYYQRNLGTNFEYIRDPNADRATLAIFGMTARDYYNAAYLGGVGDLGPLLARGDTYNGLYKTVDEQLAGFGQVDFKLTEKLKLTVGARYSVNDFAFLQAADGYINVGPSAGDGKSKEKPFTPKFGVSYQADSNNLYYATYAKGYRIGGANAPIPFLPCEAGYAQLGISEAPDTYGSDTTKSYEIGSKNRLFGGRMSVASSAYYIKWDKIQQATTIPICAYRFIDNQGSAVSKGFDVQAQAVLFEGLQVDAAFGYNDARFSETIAPAGRITVLDGTAIPGPGWTLAVGGQYDFQAFGVDSFVRADWQHAGKQRGLSSTQDPRIPRTYDANIPVPPATDYVTLRAGSRFENVEVSVFVDNLLDSNEILSRSHRARTWPAYFQSTWRPRTVSFIVAYRY
jgi:outer membrane receptor protein involved in Fe transport